MIHFKKLTSSLLILSVLLCAFVFETYAFDSVLTSVNCKYKNACTASASAKQKIYSDFKNRCDSEKYFAIPGVCGTNINGVNVENMTPQGLTFAKNYALVSAYDSMSTYNSVIYILTARGQYITTLVLSTKCHMGGLLYDSGNDVIWYCDSAAVKLVGIPFSVIDKYAKSEKDTNTVTSAENSAFYRFAAQVTPSFGTYYDGKIWYGRFDSTKTNTSSMVSCTYNISSKTVSDVINTISVPGQIQGAAFAFWQNQTVLFLSQSYGRTNNSTLYIYTDTGYTAGSSASFDYTDFTQIGHICPGMLEQIYVNNGFLYTLYESAAEVYCNKNYKINNGTDTEVQTICDNIIDTVDAMYLDVIIKNTAPVRVASGNPAVITDCSSGIVGLPYTTVTNDNLMTHDANTSAKISTVNAQTGAFIDFAALNFSAYDTVSIWIYTHRAFDADVVLNWCPNTLYNEGWNGSLFFSFNEGWNNVRFKKTDCQISFGGSQSDYANPFEYVTRGFFAVNNMNINGTALNGETIWLDQIEAYTDTYVINNGKRDWLLLGSPFSAQGEYVSARAFSNDDGAVKLSGSSSTYFGSFINLIYPTNLSFYDTITVEFYSLKAFTARFSMNWTPDSGEQDGWNYSCDLQVKAGRNTVTYTTDLCDGPYNSAKNYSSPLEYVCRGRLLFSTLKNTNASECDDAEIYLDSIIASKSPEIISGDVDGDTCITVIDALLTLRNSLGLQIFSAAAVSAADIDKDGTISAADALSILKYAVELTDEL